MGRWVLLIQTLLLVFLFAMMLHKRTLRLWYLFVFLLLLEIEVIIALYVRDRFIRPYLGDVLVTFVVYFFVKILVPRKISWLPISVFAFACMIEVFQLIHILELLGLDQYRFLRIILGTSFDWNDIMCYGVGCMLLYLMQRRAPSVL